MKLNEAVTPKPKKGDIVNLPGESTKKIAVVSKGWAYLEDDKPAKRGWTESPPSRFPIMISELRFDTKRGGKNHWKVDY